MQRAQEQDQDSGAKTDEETQAQAEPAGAAVGGGEEASLSPKHKHKRKNSTPEARLVRELGASTPGSVAFGLGLPRRRTQAVAAEEVSKERFGPGRLFSKLIAPRVYC